MATISLCIACRKWEVLYQILQRIQQQTSPSAMLGSQLLCKKNLYLIPEKRKITSHACLGEKLLTETQHPGQPRVKLVSLFFTVVAFFCLVTQMNEMVLYEVIGLRCAGVGEQLPGISLDCIKQSTLFPAQQTSRLISAGLASASVCSFRFHFGIC